MGQAPTAPGNQQRQAPRDPQTSRPAPRSRGCPVGRAGRRALTPGKLTVTDAARAATLRPPHWPATQSITTSKGKVFLLQ